jgi:polyferredoxin
MPADPKLKLVASALSAGRGSTATNRALCPARTGLPSKVEGRFRRFKWAVMAFCLAVYWGTPWLRWIAGPGPNQAVLIDLAHRRFYMFGIEIWPHEFYFVAGLLIMAGMGLFLVERGGAGLVRLCLSADGLDRLVPACRPAGGGRPQCPAGAGPRPVDARKMGKRLTKWAIFLAISFATGGAWIFYFADAPTLQREFWTGAAPGVAYACVAVLTFTTFWLGGFMREQVCVYMCPWPRIQSAMLDEKSLIVTYKDWRGEPRGSLKQAQRLPGAMGDCIDCKQCVAVCPTGIDIREGAQIGCITCGLCIDACDRVMGQVGRERGLIDYCTLDDAEHERKGGRPSRWSRRSSGRARWSISGCGARSASACCSCWAAHPPGPVGGARSQS